MKKPSDLDDTREKLRQSIIGLGERSIRKSYYPELQQRIVELEQKNAALEEEITERKLAQESAKKLSRQLQQSLKMEAIGTLAGGIAHDFNNLLAVIMGYAELAKVHSANKCADRTCPVTEDLNQILKATERAKDLTEQILTFSRQQTNEKNLLQLDHALRDALKLLRATLPKSIDIRTKFSCGEALIHANATQLHQIIMNLGANALHAMRETGGILSIETEKIVIGDQHHSGTAAVLTPGQYFLIRVCDNGCGMEKAMLDKIFDPYFTTKAKGQGTGMGLSVVHGIIRDHGGTINVYSEPGKGSSFLIYLPVANISEATLMEEVNPAVPLGKERILLIDDDQAVAEMQSNVLASLGYTVHCLTDPLKAEMFFAQNADQFDLVITDMTMPKINGADLSGRFLAIRPSIPIILCTGFSELVNEEKALAIGIKAFAMKPIIRSTIAQTIRQVLDNVA